MFLNSSNFFSINVKFYLGLPGMGWYCIFKLGGVVRVSVLGNESPKLSLHAQRQSLYIKVPFRKRGRCHLEQWSVVFSTKNTRS